jgi:predicted GNAT family acetyltransferase
MADTIDVHDNPQTRRFEASISGQTAVAQYEIGPGVITFTHTRVPESLRGKGIANALAQAALAAARARGLLVIPQCTFFATYMRRHPETRDLLAPAGRALLEQPAPGNPANP